MENWPSANRYSARLMRIPAAMVNGRIDLPLIVQLMWPRMRMFRRIMNNRREFESRRIERSTVARTTADSTVPQSPNCTRHQKMGCLVRAGSERIPLLQCLGSTPHWRLRERSQQELPFANQSGGLEKADLRRTRRTRIRRKLWILANGDPPRVKLRMRARRAKTAPVARRESSTGTAAPIVLARCNSHQPIERFPLKTRIRTATKSTSSRSIS